MPVRIDDAFLLLVIRHASPVFKQLSILNVITVTSTTGYADDGNRIQSRGSGGDCSFRAKFEALRFRGRLPNILVESFHDNVFSILFPPKFVCPQGSISSGIEALCFRIKRLAYPCRFSDLIYRFGKPPPALSMIHNEIVDFIYSQYGYLVTEWRQSVSSAKSLQTYTDVKLFHPYVAPK